MVTVPEGISFFSERIEILFKVAKDHVWGSSSLAENLLGLFWEMAGEERTALRLVKLGVIELLMKLMEVVCV